MGAHRITITIAGHGRDENDAERVLDAFKATHPEVGAVVAQNTAEDTMDVTFSLAAEDVDKAFVRGRLVFVDGMTASELEFRPPIAAHVQVIEPDRELEPA